MWFLTSKVVIKRNGTNFETKNSPFGGQNSLFRGINKGWDQFYNT